MNTKRVYAILLRQFYLVRRSPARVVQMFIWITVDITLWGFISKYLTGVTESGFSLIPIFLGAVLLWDFLIQVMQGISMSFFEDAWSHNFLNIFASPLKISEYISGLALAGVGRGILTLILMLILAGFIFGLSVLVYGTAVFLFLVVLLLFGIALGILGVSVVLRWGPPGEWFVWPIPALLSPFVGVFYPLSTLPQWMQYVGQLLPPSYVFAGVRGIVHGGVFSASPLIWGLALAAFYIFLAYQVFLYVYRRAIRTGLISRYSAEDLN